jgi:hypothetical protein
MLKHFILIQNFIQTVVSLFFSVFCPKQISVNKADGNIDLQFLAVTSLSQKEKDE